MLKSVTRRDVGSTRTNSIAFLRLALATLVIYAHSSALGGFPRDVIGQISDDRWNLGGVGVDGFFFLSGLLITRSYTHCSSEWRFLWHRFLRIFPGFWVCLLVVAFGFAPYAFFFEHCSFEGFWWPASPDQGPLSYLQQNWLIDIHQWGISGALASLPVKFVFNGSLWTLGTELRCYLIVAVIGVAGFLRRGKWATIVLFLIFYAMSASPDVSTKAIALLPEFVRAQLATPEYLQMVMFFLIGSVFCVYEERIPLNPVAFGVAVLASIAACFSPYYNLVEAFAFSYALFWLAFRLPIRDFDKPGDFSYGTYIYAYPVQQMLSMLRVNCYGFWPYFLLSCLGTAPLAIASWFLVERRAMSYKNVTLPWFAHKGPKE